MKNGRINILREQMKFPYFISTNYRQEILKLCELDNNLKLALINNDKYIFTIDIKDLYQIKPMDVMKVTRYEYLVKYLGQLGIEMRIVSKRKKPEIVNLISLDSYDTTA